MKRYYKSIKGSFFLTVCLFACSSVFAESPIALVEKITGNVFAMNDGKTRVLKPGEHLYDLAEIITEEGAQITFNDYYDHKFHLAGSGHLKLRGKSVEIKRGYLWLQSFRKFTGGDEFIIKTANSKTTYKEGEAIFSFDAYSGKSQILSVQGDFEFANLLRDYMKAIVIDGQFTFIDNEYEHGAPRTITPIGHESFMKVTGLFYGFKSNREKNRLIKMNENRRARLLGRSLASVSSASESQISSSGGFNLSQYYTGEIEKFRKIKAKRKFRPSYSKKSGIVLNIFHIQKEAEVKKRKPAAKKNVIIKRQKISRGPSSVSFRPPPKIQPAGAFEESLLDEYKKQMRHDNDVNGLIKDLKNYDQDYKKSY